MMQFIRFLIIVVFFITHSALAVQCDAIFTDPPSQNLSPNGLTPPSDIGLPLGDINCNGTSCSASNFIAGNYDFNNITINNASTINTNGKTTRIFVDSLILDSAKINTAGNREDLIIYVRNSLAISGQNSINAIVYVNAAASLNDSSINGALATAGALSLTGNSSVTYDPAARSG
jgi:MSHA biogenesis protein MshQ